MNAKISKLLRAIAERVEPTNPDLAYDVMKAQWLRTPAPHRGRLSAGLRANLERLAQRDQQSRSDCA